MKSMVKHPELAGEGRLLVDWAEAHMPAIREITREYEAKRPLEGLTVSACLHVTKETGVLAKALKALGAEVALAASNPLTTQDGVAAHLSEVGVNVFAWRGETTEEYFSCISRILDFEPSVVIDDGGDAHIYVHEERPKLIEGIVGGTEETTTGVTRLRALSKAGQLGYPVIAVNDAETKRILDNTYGTGQSTIDGIMRATSILIAGKTLVVCGFGRVGRGIALRARGMGANVVVTEVNPLTALEAHVEGFRVMPLGEAAGVGDIFVTATGQVDVIRGEHLEAMKSGAILANSGHFNVEVSLKDLEELSVGKRRVRENVEEYALRDGRKLYLLAEGRLVNLAAAEGHPPEVMMCSFANQLLSVLHLVDEGRGMKPDVYKVPEEIDGRVAEFTLRGWEIEIDSLTEKQIKYAETWRVE
ncbi:MAG: adenosylhomocysteinase [Candidatus Geothermarchaeales archaeon]